MYLTCSLSIDDLSVWLCAVMASVAQFTADQAMQLLDFSHKLDMPLLDAVVTCFYSTMGPQVSQTKEAHFIVCANVCNLCANFWVENCAVGYEFCSVVCLCFVMVWCFEVICGMLTQLMPIHLMFNLSLRLNRNFELQSEIVKKNTVANLKKTCNTAPQWINYSFFTYSRWRSY